jgi:hypothetical protein
MCASNTPPLPPFLATVDEVVTTWPGVRSKMVFGHRGWIRAGKMLGFVADEGVAIKALTGAHSAELYARPEVGPFIYNGSMEMTGWPVLPVTEPGDVDAVLSELQRVYDALVG